MKHITRLIVWYEDGKSEVWVGRGQVIVNRTFIPAEKKKDEKKNSHVFASIDFTDTDTDRERIDAAREAATE
jgi:hypothetical protein